MTLLLPPRSTQPKTASVSFVRLVTRESGVHCIDVPVATHGIDPVAIREAKADAGIVVGEVRKRIKPAEQLSQSGFAAAWGL